MTERTGGIYKRSVSKVVEKYSRDEIIETYKNLTAQVTEEKTLDKLLSELAADKQLPQPEISKRAMVLENALKRCVTEGFELEEMELGLLMKKIKEEERFGMAIFPPKPNIVLLSSRQRYR
jgi:hypothetical protein